MTNQELIAAILISVAFVSLIVIFCALLIKIYIKKIKEHNQKEITFHKMLNTAIIETQEQVLNNISQDLHDDAGQQLTSINFQLENLKLDSPELEKKLAPISTSLAQLSQSIREISHSLNNQVLLQDDFIKAMEHEAQRLRKNSRLNVNFLFEEQGRKAFSVNEKIFIYRIFQECINNCLKHSKCDTIKILIRTMPQFEMVFSDNGVGFDPNAALGKGSLGLANMKLRASDINYSLLIDSKKAEGVRITLSENKV